MYVGILPVSFSYPRLYSHVSFLNSISTILVYKLNLFDHAKVIDMRKISRLSANPTKYLIGHVHFTSVRVVKV